MTTAIEQAKREMYQQVANIRQNPMTTVRDGYLVYGNRIGEMEDALETYLEQLRQQYEEMASTAHSRFESIQSLEAANQKVSDKAKYWRDLNSRQYATIGSLQDELAKMTGSRDMFRNLHQAATHAAIERHGEPATPHQDSGDRASRAITGGWNGQGLPPAGVECEWHGPNHDGPDGWVWGESSVVAYSPCGVFVIMQNPSCWPTVNRVKDCEFRPILTQEQIAAEEIEVILSWMVNRDSERGLRGIAEDLHADGYRKQEKPSCMHSFFAIGDNQMKCTFCGVGK